MPLIYFDNAATTEPDINVVKKVTESINKYFNPSSHYIPAYEIRREIDNARETIANFLNVQPQEIYFTSGGTESDNWALRGNLAAWDHMITTKIEHKAIMNTCKYLETVGVEVTYLNVDEDGHIDLSELEGSIKANTKLISVMTVNNEIGAEQNIREISKIAKKYNVKFHTDAVQAFGKEDLDLSELNIDLLSASSHKINGLKGTGILYVKGGKIGNIIYGGGQESGLRPGTENVLGIIAMGEAVKLLDNKIIRKRLWDAYDLTSYMVELAEAERLFSFGRREGFAGYVISSDSPYIHNIVFPGLRGEQLVTLLNMNGICVSTGSACNSDSDEPSHVLTAIGLGENANSSIRVTFSHQNTKDEVKYFINVLKRIINDIK